MSDDARNYTDPGQDAVQQDIHEALGQSDSFLDFQERLSRAAQVNRPVLLVGERGTGKELAATRIHFLSPRWEGPFIALNCSALSPTLIESELFGHERGAFTGAGGQRAGRFESASGGTLFLDEIGNIPLEVQEKILRAVEYGTFERVGSSHPTQVDVRIVGATNTDLQAAVASGRFMPDLLDRLSFDVLILPPLRDRQEDISVLASYFASRMAHELGLMGVPEITEDAMEALAEYSWPGNVRELKNVIERAVYRSADNIITKGELIFDPFQKFSSGLRKLGATDGGAPITTGVAPATEKAAPTLPDVTSELGELPSFADALRELELRLLKQSLAKGKFNQRKAAELLDLTYHQFRGLYRKYQDEISE